MNGNNFGEMLRKFRERVGLSQKALAAAAEIDTSYISRIERGERNATRPIALRLAEILGLSQKEMDLWLIEAGFISPRMQSLANDGITRLIEDITKYNSAN
ncbi:MAG: helix-turn-helix transcriptional regulator [Chloroflexota bacterium]